MGSERAPKTHLDQGIGQPPAVPAATGDVRVFIVDDDRTTLTVLSAYATRNGYTVEAFDDPVEAAAALRARTPDVLVTDMVMPRLTGADLAKEALRADPDMEVILISAVGDHRTAPPGDRVGVSMFLTKPIEPDDLARALRSAAIRRGAKEYQRRMLNWMYRSMSAAEDVMAEVTLGALESLMHAMDARSPYFTGHSRTVALLSAAVAQELGLSDREIEVVRRAGLLHDVGMIGVPDAIVEKPDALTEGEMATVQQHCEIGARILSPIKHFASEALYVRDHHERWNGSGYPNGKRGDEISLGGQIVGVAEAWVGITGARAYRTTHTKAEGYELLVKHRDEWFSGQVIEALVVTDIGVTV